MQFARVFDSEEQELLRPKQGDTVISGDGTLWVVDQAGMKYLVCHRLGEPRQTGFFKRHDVRKVEAEPETEPTELLESYREAVIVLGSEARGRHG